MPEGGGEKRDIFAMFEGSWQILKGIDHVGQCVRSHLTNRMEKRMLRLTAKRLRNQGTLQVIGHAEGLGLPALRTRKPCCTCRAKNLPSA